jgi:hypothetical protein
MIRVELAARHRRVLMASHTLEKVQFDAGVGHPGQRRVAAAGRELRLRAALGAWPRRMTTPSRRRVSADTLADTAGADRGPLARRGGPVPNSPANRQGRRRPDSSPPPMSQSPHLRPCSARKNSWATSVRTWARSAAGSGASAGRPAAAVVAAMRLATSSRNGLTTPSTILNGTPRQTTFWKSRGVRFGPSSCCWRSWANGCRPQPNKVHAAGAVRPTRATSEGAWGVSHSGS